MTPINSPEEMLQTLKDGQDLFNPETNEYVFLYNDSGSIAVYTLTDSMIESLKKYHKITNGYWSDKLGTGGKIYDDPENENYDENLPSNLDYCKTYWDKPWIDCYAEFEFGSDESVELLQEYIETTFTLDSTATHLVNSAIWYVAKQGYIEADDILDALESLISDIGIERREIRQLLT